MQKPTEKPLKETLILSKMKGTAKNFGTILKNILHSAKFQGSKISQIEIFEDFVEIISRIRCTCTLHTACQKFLLKLKTRKNVALYGTSLLHVVGCQIDLGFILLSKRLNCIQQWQQCA